MDDKIEISLIFIISLRVMFSTFSKYYISYYRYSYVFKMQIFNLLSMFYNITEAIITTKLTAQPKLNVFPNADHLNLKLIKHYNIIRQSL